MGQVDLLFHLQQIDDEIRDGKKRLGRILRLEGEDPELLSAREQAAAAANELQKLRANQNELNLELRGLNSKAKNSERRLYSGVVKNPKELSDLQTEIESLSRRRGLLEDEILEIMIFTEEAEEGDKEASDSLLKMEAKRELDLQELESEKTSIIQRINDLNIERKQQTALISSVSMNAYEATINRVGLTAVVVLKGVRCGGCQVGVPASLVKAADEGQLVYCDSCSRILSPL